MISAGRRGRQYLMSAGSLPSDECKPSFKIRMGSGVAHPTRLVCSVPVRAFDETPYGATTNRLDAAARRRTINRREQPDARPVRAGMFRSRRRHAYAGVSMAPFLRGGAPRRRVLRGTRSMTKREPQGKAPSSKTAGAGVWQTQPGASHKQDTSGKGKCATRVPVHDPTCNSSSADGLSLRPRSGRRSCGWSRNETPFVEIPTMTVTTSIAIASVLAAEALFVRVLRRQREHAKWLGRVKDCRPQRW
jgi:hypothetical protein